MRKIIATLGILLLVWISTVVKANVGTFHCTGIPFERRSLKDSGVAAFYQFYRRPRSFLAAIDSYRHFYPNNTLILLGDAGCFNYKGVAQALSAFYIVSEHRLSSKNTSTFVTYDSLLNILPFFRLVFDIIDEPYVLLLEDDVRLRRPINESNLPYSINGANRLTTLPDHLLNVIAEGRGDRDFPKFYGGSGGTVFNTSFWRYAFDRLTEVGLHHFFPSDDTKYGYDQLFTAIARQFNGTVDDISEFSEVWRDNKISAIVHRYTHDYDLPLLPGDLRRLADAGENHSATPCILRT